jgi:DNA end-binding protein Ku
VRDALRRSGKVGVATVVMRGREDLAIVRPLGDALVLQKLRFAEEVKDTKELDLPHKVDIGGQQLDMAVALIDQFSASFDIRDYEDNYTEKLMKIIEAKAKGKKKKTSQRKQELRPTKTRDLMEQLKASLEKKSSRKKAS